MFGATVLAAAGQDAGGGFSIANSLRFDGSNDYLSRTFGTPTSNTTWSLSMFVKRGTLGTLQYLFAHWNGAGTSTGFAFDASNQILFDRDGATVATSTAVFRDPTAHGHLFIRSNGTNVKAYWNNAEVASYTGTMARLNSAVAHNIGRWPNNAYYFDGYLSDIYFIDGQALTPSSFGESDSNGVWVPKAYSGSFGSNGFHLDFSDGTSTTTLGYDAAGSNDWTLSGFTRSAGVNECWMTDTPTNNFATLSPIDKNSGITLSAANLDASMPTTTQNLYGSVSVSSGKWYWETTINSMTGRLVIGVANAGDPNWNLDPSSSSALWGYYSVNGNKLNASNTAYGSSFTTNDVIGVALDLDNGKIWFSKNNTWQASGDPAAGTNAAFTGMSGTFRAMYEQQLTGAVTFSANFGQRTFTNTTAWATLEAAGYKKLSTANLPSSGSVTTSGSFTGNSVADGPFVWLNGSPTAMTINGNAVTFGTHADKTAGGFKVRTSSSIYNASGSNTYSITTNAGVFGDSNSAPQPAKGNP